jgi:hypothetical protein
VAQFAVLITHREIVGGVPTESDLQAILRKYTRREVVAFLAKLNCLLTTWKNEPNLEWDVKFSHHLLPKHRESLDQIRKGPLQRVLFSRLTLLFVLKQACLACPRDALPVTTDSGRADIGMCCLMANDLALPNNPSFSDDILRKIASLLPFSDYVPFDHYPMEIARSKIMIEEIPDLPEIKNSSDFIDIRGLFQEHFGFSHQIFCELIFGCATRSLDVSPDRLDSPEALILRDTFFEKSKISADVVKQFFTNVAVSDEELSRKIQESQSRPGDDLTVFQQFPLVEIVPKRFLFVDPGFLVEKAGRGLYWALFSAISGSAKIKLPGFWGKIFESYVNSVIDKSYSAGGKFIPAPSFQNGDAAFDAYIVEGRDLIVFEHKSSVLRADAKYAGNTEKLKAELHDKFIDGVDGERKGVAQLSHNLCRFLAGERMGQMDPKDISRIYPVLVCLEGSMTAPFVARYLRDSFKDAYPRKRFPHVVTPLFTMGITDIENLLGYLGYFEFSRILDSYHSANKAPLTSMSASVVPLLRKVQPGRNLVKEKFEEFAQTMEQDLFGSEATAADTTT